jgi:hypothetical protein
MRAGDEKVKRPGYKGEPKTRTDEQGIRIYQLIPSER